MNIFLFLGITVVVVYSFIKLITSLVELDQELKREFRHMKNIIRLDQDISEHQKAGSDQWAMYR